MHITTPSTNSWLVFTDLDGTLLDHHSYSPDAALPVLKQLNDMGVPVIINSSKTPSEIAQIAQYLKLKTPQIAENGSVIFFPDRNEQQNLGADYSEICTILGRLRIEHGFKFEGFHDWSVTEIAEHTGLSMDVAQKAGERQGSEPLLWKDNETQLNVFKKLLEENQLELKRGGRFWHVMGKTDKVKAMQVLQKEYQQQWNVKPYVIALGDSANDKDMLSAADVAVVVHNPDGTPFALSETDHSASRHVIRTTLPGPEGWNEAMLELLEDC